MEQIAITKEEKIGNDWRFEVTVGTREDHTTHTVMVTQTYWRGLTKGNTSPAELVRNSFSFLLKREPKESILQSFDLTKIQLYFPEYEKEIQK